YKYDYVSVDSNHLIQTVSKPVSSSSASIVYRRKVLEYRLTARAALFTRGLAEITRLASTMGAQPNTMMGLAGIGDIILTCTGALSRNRRVGLGLEEGKELHQVLVEIGHVSEGVSNIDEVFNTACKYQIDMPITQNLLKLIRKEMTPQQVVERLLERSARFE
ncbi:NAD(P)H-dependent glycerol-3-phosphate dehydrogenase, partial [Neisseria cinerea]|uniref:NAD(P)H-dependent glycerol-3-phosphate dehydrogenase n=1 Tax=Neisseria cinerea TaxID=483 RepID=UPI002B1E4462